MQLKLLTLSPSATFLVCYDKIQVSSDNNKIIQKHIFTYFQKTIQIVGLKKLIRYAIHNKNIQI